MARIIKDFLWNSGMTVEKMVEDFGSVGYQSIELHNASKVILKMKQSGSKVFLTFTSNMVTSGLRGFFAQIVRLGMADVIVTTSASIEEDIMKSLGEEFEVKSDTLVYREEGVRREGEKLIVPLTYESTVARAVNVAELKAHITGKKENELRKVLFETPGLASARVSLWPFWVRRVPGPEKIEIAVE